MLDLGDDSLHYAEKNTPYTYLEGFIEPKAKRLRRVSRKGARREKENEEESSLRLAANAARERTRRVVEEEEERL